MFLSVFKRGKTCLLVKKHTEAARGGITAFFGNLADGDRGGREVLLGDVQASLLQLFAKGHP